MIVNEIQPSIWSNLQTSKAKDNKMYQIMYQNPNTFDNKADSLNLRHQIKGLSIYPTQSLVYQLSYYLYLLPLNTTNIYM